VDDLGSVDQVVVTVLADIGWHPVDGAETPVDLKAAVPPMAGPPRHRVVIG
jgi:hypothetical protein